MVINIIQFSLVVVLGLAFIGAGTNHFINTDFYLSMMPPYLSHHLILVYVSGVFEVLGGVGILLPSMRKMAALGLLLLTVAVFPANIYMAMEPELFPQFSAVGLMVRLPLQLVILLWIGFAYFYTAKEVKRTQ